jgi:hypothetical protein
VLGADGKPWPVFVRTGGKGQTAIRDGQYQEVLQWDTGHLPAPDPHKPETVPQIIIGAPPAAKGGFLNLPTMLRF